MGPGIQEHPLLLHQKAQKKESQINENHKGTVNYSNGKSHPSTKGVKKSVSHVKSPGRLCKNVPTTNEKTSCDAQDDNQPSVLKKGRNQPDDSTQSKQITSVCTSLPRVQGSKRSLPETRQSESLLHRIPPATKGSTQGYKESMKTRTFCMTTS
ncbi:protein FAM217B isoform X5 [Gallus gallus]|uniref:protein FAM217B isoform X5 n=1 Tax=Gallus gallus TaxID=9031 RepID=UPI001F027293|nr:protein FAM217B isoform X5 [Gallus gallus]XP_046758965.1 protein FAM217B isoform X5 [Gallus gallus]